MFEAILAKRWGKAGLEREQMIREASQDVNEEAICLALIRYKGSFPPYPRDLEDKVYDYDIEGVFMEGIRRVNEISKEEQLDGMREKIMEALQ